MSSDITPTPRPIAGSKPPITGTIKIAKCIATSKTSVLYMTEQNNSIIILRQSKAPKSVKVAVDNGHTLITDFTYVLKKDGVIQINSTDETFVFPKGTKIELEY